MIWFVDHQADIAVELEADSRSGLFQAGLEAIIALLTIESFYEEAFDGDIHSLVDEQETDGLLLKVSDTFSISADGSDDEERLIGLMNEMLFACQIEDWWPISVESVTFNEDNAVTAVINGFFKKSYLNFKREIKAATYHNLKIRSSPKWTVKVVLDV